MSLQTPNVITPRTMTSVAPIMLKDRRSRGPPASQLQLLIVGTLCLAVSHGFSPFCPIKCSPQAIRVHCPVARLTTQFKTRKTARKLQTRLQTATAAPSNVPPKPILQKPLLSASALVILDIAFRRLFQTLSIDFPSSLAGCGFLLASLLTLPFGEKLYESLSPGSTLLAKWLPVFFVPSLITLPLEGGLGSAIEYGKVALVVIGGFYFTLVSTAISVLAIRDLLSSSNDEFPETVRPLEEISNKSDISTEDDADTSIETDAPPLNSSFSDKLTMDMRVLKVASAITATVASLVPAASTMVTPLTTAFLLFTTLDAFVFGARLPKRFTKIVHPLVTCTAGTWLSMKLFGLINGFSFPTMLHKYRTGMITLTGAGAGDILLFLLGPAVISLACQMYDRRKLIQENFAEVTTAVLVSSLGGLFGTAFAVRALEIGNPALRLSLLSRNITSPLAIAICSILGGDVPLAVSMVVITGLIGANFGATILNALGIDDAVARGLGIGAAAHGLGTAAFANEEDAFPFAAIAMCLTASASTVLVSIPAIKKAILQIALGW